MELRQRLDQACQGEGVPLNTEGLEKNTVLESDFVSDGRVAHGVSKPGKEAISLTTHTASSPCTGTKFDLAESSAATAAIASSIKMLPGKTWTESFDAAFAGRSWSSSTVKSARSRPS